jgi:DNA primase
MTTDKHNIAPVLEHYGATRIRDCFGWQKIKCPVHEDGTASASVNIQENVFVCHACGVKGDTYSVIMEKEGVGFVEALSIAENITGESRNNIQKVNSSSRRLSSQARTNTGRRGYSPPRSGRRSTA